MNEKTVDGVKMIVVPLDGLDAIDLGNELLANLAPGVAAGVLGAKTFGGLAAIEAIGLASSALTGKLSGILPRLLAGTTVTAGGMKYDLSKGAAEVNRFLAEHPAHLKTIVMYSLEAQFSRFFPASVIAAVRTKMRSLSADFSQNMSGTGSSTA